MSVPVFEAGDVIAQVEYNDDLDYWDGRNYTCGSTGRHLGCTKLKSGKYVLIHGTQWEGERDSAEVVTGEELLKAAARTGSMNLVLERYPELKKIGLPDEEEDFKEPELMEAIVVEFGSGAHITVPKAYIGKKIVYRVID